VNNKAIKDILKRNETELTQVLENNLKEVSKLMDEGHDYDQIGHFMDNNDEMGMGKYIEGQFQYFLTLGYLLGKNGGELWETVLKNREV
jgi:hypothetical protein